jgi:hypothetical protein
MTLDEFVANSQASILAFKAAYEEMAKTNETFHPERSEDDWWREVAAYSGYVELEERFKQHGSN